MCVSHISMWNAFRAMGLFVSGLLRVPPLSPCRLRLHDPVRKALPSRVCAKSWTWRLLGVCISSNLVFFGSSPIGINDFDFVIGAAGISHGRGRLRKSWLRAEPGGSSCVKGVLFKYHHPRPAMCSRPVARKLEQPGGGERTGPIFFCVSSIFSAPPLMGVYGPYNVEKDAPFAKSHLHLDP